MLYRALLAMIGKGRTEGLAEKLDIFFAVGKLTEDQYNTLTEMLTNAEE